MRSRTSRDARNANLARNQSGDGDKTSKSSRQTGVLSQAVGRRREGRSPEITKSQGKEPWGADPTIHADRSWKQQGAARGSFLPETGSPGDVPVKLRGS